MSAEDLIQTLGGRYSPEEIRAAYKKAVEQVGGEGKKTDKVTALLLKQNANVAKNAAKFLYVSPVKHNRKQQYAYVEKLIKEKPEEAIEKKVAAVFEKRGDHWVATYPTPGGEFQEDIDDLTKVFADADGNGVPVNMINDELGFVVLDTQKSYGPRANENYLKPIPPVNDTIFALGVSNYKGENGVAYLRINDHFGVPVTEVPLPLGQSLALSNVVAEKQGNVIRMNSTKDMMCVPGEDFIDDAETNALLEPTPIAELVDGETTMIHGDVYTTIIREPGNTKKHLVGVSDDPFSSEDTGITVFLPSDFEINDIKLADEVIAIGRKFRFGTDGVGFDADFLVVVPDEE